jgi:hypothetical protein
MFVRFSVIKFLITHILYNDQNESGVRGMAYIGSKGWYVAKLKEQGIRRHPIERKKLELYKTYILRKLYEQQKQVKNQ